MTSYMPQDIFNMSAVTAASCYGSEEVTIDKCASFISDQYRNDYIDDGFEKDIVIAAHKIVALIQQAFPGKPVSSAIRQMQYCIKTYEPNGKKKGFFQGQLFNKQKQPIPDRVSQCVANIMTFHIGTLSGAFPVAPRDWSI